MQNTDILFLNAIITDMEMQLSSLKKLRDGDLSQAYDLAQVIDFANRPTKSRYAYRPLSGQAWTRNDEPCTAEDYLSDLVAGINEENTQPTTAEDHGDTEPDCDEGDPYGYPEDLGHEEALFGDC